MHYFNIGHFILELDVETSLPIPMRNPNLTAAQMMNFAKSLPIEIANSPMAERTVLAHVREDVSIKSTSFNKSLRVSKFLCKLM